jgi:molybdate transport system substrate-binding protein
MPPNLAIRADYGMTIPSDASPEANRLREFILSSASQAVFTKYGFARL